MVQLHQHLVNSVKSPLVFHCSNRSCYVFRKRPGSHGGDSWIRKIIIILQLYPIIIISHEISSCCLVIIKKMKPLYGGSKPCYPRSLGTSKYLVNGWFFLQGMGQFFSAPGTGNRRPRGGGRKGGSCRLGVKSVISWTR